MTSSISPDPAAVSAVEPRRLPDAEARELVARYGVPANRVAFSGDAASAGTAAAQLGADRFALKLVADAVVHKSAAGGVRLDVGSHQVTASAQAVLDDAQQQGLTPTGVTVEAMLPSGLEAVVGGLWDPNFGPVVMFGSGGVDVEQLGDVAFAAAPLSREGARALLRRTRIGAVIAHRMPHQLDAVVDALLGVGGAAGLLLNEPVLELDINPLILTEDTISAVDSRATLGAPAGLSPVPEPAVAYQQLRPGIYPESVAVLGASADERKLGYRAVRNLVDFGFEGPLTPVTRSGALICGLPSVTSIEELPEGVDRAVIALPAGAVGQALEDLAARGARTAHILTSDTPPFPAPVGPGGLRVFGPNTIGHYSPSAKVTMIAAEASSPEPGGIAVVSQSGTYAGDVVRRGNALGIRFSFVSSVGNCEDVSPSELLAFCEADERTTASIFYLEGDADAARFFRLAATCSKPIFLLQGGRTRAGTEAAASHTGALASDPRVLTDIAAQSGVIQLETLDELMDVAMALQHLPAFHGDGLGLLGSGGGVAVVGSDTAERAVLRLPALSEASEQAMEQFRAPGVSLANPVDIPIWSLFGPQGAYTADLLEVMATDDAVSVICAYLDVGTVFDMPKGDEAEALLRQLTEGFLSGNLHGKPLALVLRSGFDAEQEHVIRVIRDEAGRRGVATFDSVDRAITALGKLRQAALRGGWQAEAD